MALLGGVQRGLDRRQLTHRQFFSDKSGTPTNGFAPASTAAPDTAADRDIPARIREAYASLAGSAGGYVMLADLRERLAAISRDDLDPALRQLNREPDIHLQPAANLKALDARHRDAALYLGGEDCHVFMIEAP